ncbi:MAG: methyltransferase domain-containing protein [Candidatus Electrothrix sp. YB6]
MTTLHEHWNAIFSAKPDQELGWYEQDVAQTLKFLDCIPQNRPATIFLAGSGTSLLVDELAARGHRLILNDISDEALNRLSNRIGRNSEVIWLHHDIAQSLPDHIPRIDIWIDRAVLHFLLKEEAIQGYFVNVHAAVRQGGYALLAEFSTAGASECAGLAVHRYSIEEMTGRMGMDFKLVQHEAYTYVNPFGSLRPYLYALYRKK